MYPNPQDAFPLPARPNIEQYKKRAKDLLGQFRAGELKASDEFHAFAARELSSRPALTTAQFVIARAHGFASWPKFAKHIERLPASKFEAAADAIAAGDRKTLEPLLREDPKLIRERSAREHHATLLHYVSANGIENFRQKTPKSIVAIARHLLDAGADVNAECDVYGGRATTLNLVGTSVHPHRAGVQIDLMQLLLDRGAEIRPGDVRACLANGRGPAAEFLASKGAPLTPEESAGVGRLDWIRNQKASADDLRHGFLWACQYGHNAVVEYMLDNGLVDLKAHDIDKQTALHHAVMGAQPGTIRLLIDRGASLEARNIYNGTPLGQARWCAHNNDNAADFEPIIELLRGAGAES